MNKEAGAKKGPRVDGEINLDRFKETGVWPEDNETRRRCCFKSKKMGWKSYLALDTILSVMETALLLFVLIFCIMLFLVHLDNHKKRELNYGQKGRVSRLDLLRVEFREQLQELALQEGLYWLFVVIFFICFASICRAYERKQAAQDEVHHLVLLRRYFYALALQDLRRYGADSEYENVAISNWLASSQNPE